MNPQNIEVEIRAFISKEKYEELLRFFEQNAEFVKEDFQETHYFDCEQDLRIQKNNAGSKIWLKKGQIHDDAREEIEIKTSKDDFENIERLFKTLDYNVEIKWLRKRFQFNWQGIKVCIDYTKGYGYILELEKMSNEENKEETLNLLKQKLNELNVQETPKEIFKEKYNYYKENWRNLI
jgi:predicted adenylyl cyclase CyaB